VGLLQPGSWREALKARAAPPGAKLIWGGTDVMVELNFDRERPLICSRDRILETFRPSEPLGTEYLYRMGEAVLERKVRDEERG
jgi:hypothetical protein